MRTDLDIRPVTADEFPAFSSAVSRAFGHDMHPDDNEPYRSIMPLERTLAAFDGDQIVGNAAALSLNLTVPGGADVACAGVTAVGVRSDHRRQGVLTALMRHQLDEVRERGEPLAALYASESPIYGRFGYGLATRGLSISIDRPWTKLRRPSTLLHDVRLVDAEEAIKRCPVAFERVRATRSGMVGRDEALWRFWLAHDEERHRDGASKRYHALLGDRGYAIYRVKPRWRDGVPHGVLQVMELVATDLDALVALWQFCFNVDLIARVEVQNRPVDDELTWLLDNPARLRSKVFGHLYVRAVDVGRALSVRRYAAKDTVVFDVDDPFCDWNSGRWRLDAGPQGAECVRTDDDADLHLDARELGATYLGDAGFRLLARAGLIEELTPGALARADAMFTTSPAPWNLQEF